MDYMKPTKYNKEFGNLLIKSKVIKYVCKKCGSKMDENSNNIDCKFCGEKCALTEINYIDTENGKKRILTKEITNMIIDIRTEIITLLEKNLIKPENGLKSIYNKIIKYHEFANKENVKVTELINILHPQLLNKKELVGCLQKEHATTMAIDFPIEIKKSKESNRQKIMICALDSLPPDLSNLNHWNKFYLPSLSQEEYLECHKKYITPWAPFSLIDNWKFEKGSFKQNISFFLTLFDDFDLYVTDIYKLFYRIEKKRSTGMHGENEMKLFNSILQSEIEIIKPDAIVTLGNNSRNALLNFLKVAPEKWGDDVQSKNNWNIGNMKTKIISIPHISGAANGAKSKILKNIKYSDVAGDNTVKLAGIVIKNIKQGEAENL